MFRSASLAPRSAAYHAARGLLARPSRHLSSSLMNRVFGMRPLFDTPFSLLPRLIEEDFTRSLDLLNRAVGGLVHVETDEKTKVRLCAGRVHKTNRKTCVPRAPTHKRVEPSACGNAPVLTRRRTLPSAGAQDDV